MTRWLTYPGVLTLTFCLLSLTAQAQFLDLNLEIDSRLSTATDQQLTFMPQKINSGQNSIDLGSNNMGIFRITALEQQVLLLDLSLPDSLDHLNPAVKSKVPVELEIRYGYSSEEYDDSDYLSPGLTCINVRPDSGYGPWRAVYIFIYGSFDTQGIPPGTYMQDIVLTMEYI